MVLTEPERGDSVMGLESVHARQQENACMQVKCRTMRVSILTALVLLAAETNGEVTHVPIRSGVVLQPDEAYTVTIEAAAPAEIGWRMVQAKACATSCVQATELTSPSHSLLLPQWEAAKAMRRLWARSLLNTKILPASWSPLMFSAYAELAMPKHVNSSTRMPKAHG